MASTASVEVTGARAWALAQRTAESSVSVLLFPFEREGCGSGTGVQ